MQSLGSTGYAYYILRSSPIAPSSTQAPTQHPHTHAVNNIRGNTQVHCMKGRRPSLWGDWVENRVSPCRSAYQASPWRLLRLSLGRRRRKAAWLVPESWWYLTMWGSRPSHFMIIPNTKRHPNSTKTGQLPIFGVNTGLPRPYLHIPLCSPSTYRIPLWT